VPAAKTVAEILNSAGCKPSEIVRARAGRPERNLPGYRIQSSEYERRVIHVFHVGRAAKSGLLAYAAALEAAGFVVAKRGDGLRVTSRRQRWA
jgi:hypothetical protein